MVRWPFTKPFLCYYYCNYYFNILVLLLPAPPSYLHLATSEM